MEVKVREWDFFFFLFLFHMLCEGGPLSCRRDGLYTVGFINSVNV